MCTVEKEVIRELDRIYLSYFDQVYDENQLKKILRELYLKTNIEISRWSELILDAQWKHATEEDYQEKRNQLYLQSQFERGGDMFFCKCGGLLLVKEIEEYPSEMKGNEKIEFDRKCSAECVECGKKYDNLMYD